MEQDIIKLQETVAYQQEEISKLSEELYVQQKEIIALRRLCENLKAQQERSADAEQADQGPERPPPHY